jgi:hypothetical protein
MKSKSNFSIGSFDSELSPLDNGKVLRASKEVGECTKSKHPPVSKRKWAET